MSEVTALSQTQTDSGQPPILQLEQINRSFNSGNSQLHVLKNIEFNITKGTSCAIVGPSGSGKTTLLGLCAGLDTPDSGRVLLDGSILSDMNEDQRADIRNKKVGFIFQNFQLLPTLTALENVMVPLELRGGSNNEIEQRAVELLSSVGLKNRLTHYPSQLSGGEQQRVAIARAFINEPSVLFADEPTGNLDAETGDQVEELLFNLNKEKQTTLVIVTHDLLLAQKCEQQIRLHRGEIAEQRFGQTLTQIGSNPSIPV